MAIIWQSEQNKSECFERLFLIYVEFEMGRIQISRLLLYLRDRACIIPYYPKNALFHQFKDKTMRDTS